MTHTIEDVEPDSTATGDTDTGDTGLAVALVRLSHLVHRVFDEVSRDYDLTPQQTQLLCRLVNGRVGMAELGRMLHLEKSSLTGLVDRVEKRGLVTRTRDSRDRRAYQIVLTSQGEKLGTDSHRSVTDRLEALVGDVPPADREQLTAVITRMLATHDPANERS